MMKQTRVLILAGILCVLLAAAGCTGSTPPATTTPAATTAAPVENLTNKPATSPPAPETPSWTGTWNSSWREKDGNLTPSVLTLSQKGREVTGNYSFTYPGEGTFNGSLNATVQAGTLTGAYAESDDDTGFFVFTLGENRNSFTGRWVHAANRSELENSTLFWNGTRQ
jgi:hypothetical protein